MTSVPTLAEVTWIVCGALVDWDKEEDEEELDGCDEEEELEGSDDDSEEDEEDEEDDPDDEDDPDEDDDPEEDEDDEPGLYVTTQEERLRQVTMKVRASKCFLFMKSS